MKWQHELKINQTGLLFILSHQRQEPFCGAHKTYTNPSTFVKYMLKFTNPITNFKFAEEYVKNNNSNNNNNNNNNHHTPNPLESLLCSSGVARLAPSRIVNRFSASFKLFLTNYYHNHRPQAAYRLGAPCVGENKPNRHLPYATHHLHSPLSIVI